jgi:NADPH2:quinone reductase
VRAAGVNPVDAGNRADGGWAGLRVPCILGYDIADLVGGRLAQAALPALRPGGQIAAIATPELDLDPLLDASITFHGVLIQDDGDRTRALAGLLDQGELRPAISRRLPLEAAAEAHRILENGHAGGKIVLDVTSSLG